MKPLIFLLLLFPSWIFAQVTDTFDDGDLTRNPAWTGTLQRFKVNAAHQLQLNDTTTGSAWIFTPAGISGQTEWRFWIKAAFSPSSKNFIRVYLHADYPNPDSLTGAYYLQLGEKGSADALELFRKSHDTVVSVCRGTDGQIAGPFAMHIRVLRDTSGNWQIWTDSAGDGRYTKTASGNDSRYHQAGFFGLYCRYTKSNARKIYFDDFYTGPPLTDTTAPHADSVAVVNDSTLELFFSESVDTVTGKNPENYLLKPATGTIKRIVFLQNNRMAKLVFDAPFRNQQTYTLTISDIEDVAGNRSAAQSLSFVFIRIQSYDVVINEIMADPTPSAGLPEYEYLELLNRTAVDLNLQGWKLALGKSVRIFGKAVLPARGYLILCKTSATDAFSSFGKVYGISGFGLTNSGESIRLYDKEGKLISSVQYRKNWYRDPDKADGGWSLEQVNPENVCSGSDNWKVSTNSKGGTPGKQNSVFDTLVLKPYVINLVVPDARTTELFFSQKMDSLSLTSTDLYAISPGQNQVDSAITDGFSSVKLFLKSAADTSSVYHLMVSGNIKNCTGIAMGTDTTLRFGVPQTVRENDVVINEVLFYPLEGGADYVELYNRSHKIIDVSSLILGTVKNHPPNPPDSLFYDLSFEQKLFFPGDYLLLTASPQKVKAQYHTPNPAAFFKVTPFPVFNHDKGSVLLYRQLNKIDAFDYDEKMQYPLLNYTQGVALERVSADAPTKDPDNWHSASQSVGFGTPGYRNSQSTALKPDSLPGEITVNPEIFSPDNDGYQDVLHIYYRFKTAGNTVSVDIFNAAGQEIRKLVNNAYVGTSGVFSWDGLQDDDTKVPVGIYVLFIRAFDPGGHVRQWKKTVVLATKL
jgi:hypothetical protein